MNEVLGQWETVFDVENLADMGDIDAFIAALRPDVIYTIKNAIADWELDADQRGREGSGGSGSGVSKPVPGPAERD